MIIDQRQQTREEWRRLRKKECHTLLSSPDTIRRTKSHTNWTDRLTQEEQLKNAFKFFQNSLREDAACRLRQRRKNYTDQ